VLLTAGSGGQTGWMNPLAFVRAVRQFFAGRSWLAGGIGDGCALLAAQVLRLRPRLPGHRVHRDRGVDGRPEYKRMLVQSSLDDVVLTSAFTGPAHQHCWRRRCGPRGSNRRAR